LPELGASLFAVAVLREIGHVCVDPRWEIRNVTHVTHVIGQRNTALNCIRNVTQQRNYDVTHVITSRDTCNTALNCLRELHISHVGSRRGHQTSQSLRHCSCVNGGEWAADLCIYCIPHSHSMLANCLRRSPGYGRAYVFTILHAHTPWFLAQLPLACEACRSILWEVRSPLLVSVVTSTALESPGRLKPRHGIENEGATRRTD